MYLHVVFGMAVSVVIIHVFLAASLLMSAIFGVFSPLGIEKNLPCRHICS